MDPRDELEPRDDADRDEVERDDVDRDRDAAGFAAPLERAVERAREVRRVVRPVRRSAAGISSVATALVSCGSSFVRNAAMRSSWRRWSRASFSVSLSPTALASSSIAT